MASNRISLWLAYPAVLLTALFSPGTSTPVAVAQDRRSESDDDRRDEGDGSAGRRERFRSFRRGRSNANEDREDRERRESSSSRESSESRPSDDGPSMNMTDYAKGLVTQYDKNGNNWLDGDERSQLRGRAAGADANNDGAITVDELVAALSSPTATTTSSSSSSAPAASARDSEDRSDDRGRDRGDRGRGSQRSSSSTESSGGKLKRVYTGSVSVGKSNGDENNQRRTYRFTPAGEKLPTGLPSWFTSRDKNGDGQVFMSEYSRTWSKRLVDEFRRYDTNDDGVITAKEAAKK
jgi:Ca2+-binding EF-hand superfamily protein